MVSCSAVDCVELAGPPDIRGELGHDKRIVVDASGVNVRAVRAPPEQVSAMANEQRVASACVRACAKESVGSECTCA